jgi:hypothetical protein
MYFLSAYILTFPVILQTREKLFFTRTSTWAATEEMFIDANKAARGKNRFQGADRITRNINVNTPEAAIIKVRIVCEWNLVNESGRCTSHISDSAAKRPIDGMDIDILDYNGDSTQRSVRGSLDSLVPHRPTSTHTSPSLRYFRQTKSSPALVLLS